MAIPLCGSSLAKPTLSEGYRRWMLQYGGTHQLVTARLWVFRTSGQPLTEADFAAVARRVRTFDARIEEARYLPRLGQGYLTVSQTPYEISRLLEGLAPVAEIGAVNLPEEGPGTRGLAVAGSEALDYVVTVKPLVPRPGAHFTELDLRAGRHSRARYVREAVLEYLERHRLTLEVDLPGEARPGGTFALRAVPDVVARIEAFDQVESVSASCAKQVGH